MGEQLRHAEVEELLGAYALDAVSPEEAAAIEAHLAGCPRCRAEVAGHREAAAMLSEGGPPPEGVWDRIAGVLEEAAPTLDLERVRRRRAGPALLFRVAAAAAAVAVIGVLGIKVVDQDRRLDQLAAAAEQQGLREAAAAAVLDPDHVTLVLRSPDGRTLGEAVLLPEGGGYLIRDSFEPLPQGRTYQLWSLGGEEPISAGLLGSDPGVAAINVGPGTVALAVTNEAAGGAVAPGSDPLASGEVETA
jgi:Anti-sigma-K factor rskA/Putative zinc-finger